MPRLMRRIGESSPASSHAPRKKPKLSKFEQKIDGFVNKNIFLHKRMNAFLKEGMEFLIEIKKDIKEMKELLGSVKNTNEEVDSTLCKVLLAIRQNEYLQAWHPDKDPSNPFIKHA
jgi:hypothetical protein